MPPALSSFKYDDKKPLEWLQMLRDYMAGRCEEVDDVLNWVEARAEPIVMEELPHEQNLPMTNDIPNMKELSRQLWAMLNPLVADSRVADAFANVPRHNGLEAWRQLAEPINEDKELLQKDLLPLVTNPRPASSMDKVEDAVLEWDTNMRHFKKAGGVEPPDYQKRITIIRMLPIEVGAYISMHCEKVHLQVHQDDEELEATHWQHTSRSPG